MKLIVSPKLKCGNDALVAQRLQDLVRDAEDGLRRVLKAGLYIEWIASQVPHGRLEGWLEAHTRVPLRTVRNWRTLARSVCEWISLRVQTMSAWQISADQLIDLPPHDLPTEARLYRERIDGLIESANSHGHTTCKQLMLFLTFKQGEADGDVNKPKRGRLKGQGRPPNPDPSPCLSIEDLIAGRRRAAIRAADKITRQLQAMGIDCIALDDAQREVLAQSLRRTLACLDAFNQQPAGRKHVPAIQACWHAH